jgi:hypothetical protein
MVLNFNRITGTLYHPSLSDATKIVDDPRKTDIPGQGAYRLFQRNVIYCPEKRILYFISDRSVPTERSKHEVRGECSKKQCFFWKKIPCAGNDSKESNRFSQTERTAITLGKEK